MCNNCANFIITTCNSRPQLSSVPHPLLGGEMLFVHSTFAHLVACRHPLVRVLTCDRRLMVPAWLIARHAGMIFRDIPSMGVAHVPVWEVFNVTAPLQVLMLLGGG